MSLHDRYILSDEDERTLLTFFTLLFKVIKTYCLNLANPVSYACLLLIRKDVSLCMVHKVSYECCNSIHVKQLNLVLGNHHIYPPESHS